LKSVPSNKESISMWAWVEEDRALLAKGSLVLAHVLLELSLKLLHEVFNQAVVEVLSSEVGVSGGGLHLEDALFDGQ
jgi:hypothetical protein